MLDLERKIRRHKRDSVFAIVECGATEGLEDDVADSRQREEEDDEEELNSRSPCHLASHHLNDDSLNQEYEYHHAQRDEGGYV